MGLHPLIMIFKFLMNLKFTSYQTITLVILEWVVIDHFLHSPLSFIHEFIV
jgi:hypothetical protein